MSLFLALGSYKEPQTMKRVFLTMLFAATLLPAQQKTTTAKTTTQHSKESPEHMAIRELYEDKINECDRAWERVARQHPADVSDLEALERKPSFETVLKGSPHADVSALEAIYDRYSQERSTLRQPVDALNIITKGGGNLQSCYDSALVDDTNKTMKDEYLLLESRLIYVDSCVTIYRITINKENLRSHGISR